MHPFSSFISSSNMHRARSTIAWAIAGLILVDITINAVFPPPGDGSNAAPARLVSYFELGRSIEGKIRKMVGPTAETSDPLALAAWPLEVIPPSARNADPAKIMIAAYGQSFTGNVMTPLAKMEPSVALRPVLGPSAPLSFAYSRYLDERGKIAADVVVLGVVAESFRALETMTASTWGFERPPLYTYPRYTLSGGKLTETRPLIESLTDLRRTISDPVLWQGYVDQLRQHDAYFDPVLFDAGISDRSAIVRLLRRGWGHRHHHKVLDHYYDSENGFAKNTKVVAVAQEIVRDFVKKVREDGQVPIVLLFNTRGYSDHLFRALGPTLEELQADYVSTHTYAPASARSNFTDDGHFKTEVDQETANYVRAILASREILRP
jgi:hypothetical protein